MKKDIVDFNDFNDKPIIFRGAQKRKNSVELIPSETDILEIVNGVPKRRLIRYDAGESEIYADKQSELSKKKKTPPIRIGHKILPVQKSQVTLLEYLRKADYNGSKPGRDTSKPILYYENIPGKAADKFLFDDKKLTEMKYMIHNMETEDVETFCVALGINGIESKMTQDLRRDLIVLASNKPKLFEDAHKNMPKMKRKYHILNAISLGILDKRNNIVYWAGGNPVAITPPGIDAIDFIVDFSYDPNGELFYAELKSRMNIKPAKTESELALSEMTEEEDAQFDEYLDNLINKKLIWREKLHYKYKDKNKDEILASSRKQVKNILFRNPEIKSIFDKKLEDIK